jgi:hypothetical protein
MARLEDDGLEARTPEGAGAGIGAAPPAEPARIGAPHTEQ